MTRAEANGRAQKLWRKKPVVIEAVRLTADNMVEVMRWAGNDALLVRPTGV